MTDFTQNRAFNKAKFAVTVKTNGESSYKAFFLPRGKNWVERERGNDRWDFYPNTSKAQFLKAVEDIVETLEQDQTVEVRMNRAIYTNPNTLVSSVENYFRFNQPSLF